MQQLKQLVYMRQMPSNLIAFSSKEGKRLFKEALDQNTMECYFPLAEQFITQLHPTTCGSTTLVMVLNALKIDPGVQWKGIWKWYTEENLHGLKKEHLENGIDLDAFSHIAKHNKVAIQTFYHPNLYEQQYEQKNFYDCQQNCTRIQNQHKIASLQTFYTCLEASSRMDRLFMVVNNSRKIMGQTGEGHFSPIGGIHLKEKKVMLFDVARFKYPPQWCDFDLLYNSIAPIDKDNNMTRGFALITKTLDYDIQSQYSRQVLQDWFKNKTETSDLPNQLSVIFVYYLFIVLQRIEMQITNIHTIPFQLALREESRYNIDQALIQIKGQKNLHSLISDFTFQYPDLITTISCLLYNILCGYQISHRELTEEYELMRMILAI
ncbi:unnamed protein product [Paramecium pentaurelia]|uniref:glutathione gamma-glutamylcysteinyltransferase n=1 Tax=Paramecium pentaurelia TaxID=43138 RepID=A0A8S1VH79_9CILI|nr:unnamed protein product [Paramecium pentaurelia]